MAHPARSTLLVICSLALAMALPAVAASGDLDTSFSGDGSKTVDYSGSVDTFNGVAVNGSASLACGESDSTQTDAILAAFTPSGGLDTSFSGDGKWRSDLLGGGSSFLDACRFLPDGRVVAVGAARRSGGEDRLVVVVRRPNGRADQTFSGDGIAAVRFPDFPNSYGYDLAIQPDGKIVAVGETYDNSFSPPRGTLVAARLKPNGALDPTFSGDGRVTINWHGGDEGAWKVELLPDGRMVLAGWVRDVTDTEWNTAVARLMPDGSLDTTFSGDGKAELNLKTGDDDWAYGPGVRSDGKIVLGLHVESFGQAPRIARLKPGGGLDDSLSGDGILTGFAPDLDLRDLTLVGGKILVGGHSTPYPILMRLGPGGALDTTFGTGGTADLTGVTGLLYDIAVDAQGRVLAVGGSSNDGQVFRVLG